MSNDLSFIHRFVPGNRPEALPLLLLHGTGGDENDLLPLGQAVAPGAPLLSVRGQVLEHGMPRFFRRLAEGVFDEDDVRRRAGELADFVEAARQRYDLAAPVALGYSNGANIAWSLLLNDPGLLKGAILLRAMLPHDPRPLPDLRGIPVLLIAATHDEMIPVERAGLLAALLGEAGADVTYEVLPAAHGLTGEDIVLVSEWLARHG